MNSNSNSSPKHRCLEIVLSCLIFVVSWGSALAADNTCVYAVQIHATVQDSPPQITLNWIPDPYGVTNQALYRKSRTASSWGTGTILPTTATSYVDANVAVGTTYEYQVVKQVSIGYTGYGYIYSGINIPMVENRGKVLLIVATNSTVPLSFELGRLQSDLIGDGWQVIRHDVSSNQTAVSVKSMILADYQADPANVQAAFLFGHVPIVLSTNLDYDGHLARPMPADAYYGEMTSPWPTDPASSPGFLPSDVELMVGRVDLFNMPGNNAPVAWPNETELLRNYLNKDHNWRHKLIQANRRGLMGNLRGDEQGEATATSGYRNFDPLVGPGNTIEANVAYEAPPEQRWISMLAAGSYLWAYGCGAGAPTALSGLGTNDSSFVWSTDVVGQDAKAVFVMLFGSWFGQWDLTDDLMRSFLATPTMGLTCCMAGRPHWFMHHMGLGEPIGYSTRLSMNNSTLYRNNTNRFMRAVYVALMGDPTLRMDQVAPPVNPVSDQISNSVTLSWSASPDDVAGYYVYRSSSSNGPFARLTPALISATTYSDAGIAPGAYTYVVRAVKLESTPSGSYYNASQGIFTSIQAGAGILLTATKGPAGLVLSWNSTPGASYHVEARFDLTEGAWTDLSGNLFSAGMTTTWTDTNWTSAQRRFYRISSP